MVATNPPNGRGTVGERSGDGRGTVDDSSWKPFLASADPIYCYIVLIDTLGASN